MIVEFRNWGHSIEAGYGVEPYGADRSVSRLVRNSGSGGITAF